VVRERDTVKRNMQLVAQLRGEGVDVHGTLKAWEPRTCAQHDQEAPRVARPRALRMLMLARRSALPIPV
jgi:hypothetical protein